MMAHRGPAGVEYRGEADLDTQALGICRNRAHCPRGSLEQEIVDDGLVLVGDGGKAMSRTPNMYVDEKSDEAVVLAKRLNKGRQLPAEVVEGRASPKGNSR
jgi:hypothetical protein